MENLNAFLQKQHIVPQGDIIMGKVRDPDTKVFSQWFNGDRFVYTKAIQEALPRFAYISDHMVRIYHDGQPDPEDQLCTNCFQTSHTRRKCSNQPACKGCRQSSHVFGDPSCPAKLLSQENVRLVQGNNDPLSNFWEEPVKVFGFEFPSGDNAYHYDHALRVGDEAAMKRLEISTSAKDAKIVSKTIKYHPMWSTQRVDVMWQVLQAKSQQSHTSRRHLRESGDKILAHSVQGDYIWGTGLNNVDTLSTANTSWLGRNVHGQMLKQLRNSLLPETSSTTESTEHQQLPQHGTMSAPPSPRTTAPMQFHPNTETLYEHHQLDSTGITHVDNHKPPKPNG